MNHVELDRAAAHFKFKNNELIINPSIKEVLTSTRWRNIERIFGSNSNKAFDYFVVHKYFHLITVTFQH